jgi:hypothetical protein
MRQWRDRRPVVRWSAVSKSHLGIVEARSTVNNTPSDPQGDSPGRPPPPPRLHRFEWPAKGQDCPRLDWPSYLKLLADDLDRALGGVEGHYVGNWLLGLAIQAHELGAMSPSQQEELAQSEADRAAAYLQALLQAAEQPGAWVIIQPNQDDLSDDANGGWGGHESNPDFGEPADGAQRGYFSRDVDDETWVN